MIRTTSWPHFEFRGLSCLNNLYKLGLYCRLLNIFLSPLPWNFHLVCWTSWFLSFQAQTFSCFLKKISLIKTMLCVKLCVLAEANFMWFQSAIWVFLMNWCFFPSVPFSSFLVYVVVFSGMALEHLLLVWFHLLSVLLFTCFFMCINWLLSKCTLCSQDLASWVVPGLQWHWRNSSFSMGSTDHCMLFSSGICCAIPWSACT